nr:baculoviral IAP repeat-containing protein 1a-like [Cavia porcellus]
MDTVALLKLQEEEHRERADEQGLQPQTRSEAAGRGPSPPATVHPSPGSVLLLQLGPLRLQLREGPRGASQGVPPRLPVPAGQRRGQPGQVRRAGEDPSRGAERWPTRYREQEARLASFQDWPFCVHAVSPRGLAASGLVFTGHRDTMQCFSCGGCLGNWEEGDDPWQEHARWFPKCEFLQSKKSSEETAQYIQSYQGFVGMTGEHFVNSWVKRELPVASGKNAGVFQRLCLFISSFAFLLPIVFHVLIWYGGPKAKLQPPAFLCFGTGPWKLLSGPGRVGLPVPRVLGLSACSLRLLSNTSISHLTYSTIILLRNHFHKSFLVSRSDSVFSKGEPRKIVTVDFSTNPFPKKTEVPE